MKKKNTIGDVKVTFKSCTVEPYTLQICLLYFVKVVLLGREISNQINLKYLKLVENMIMWNQYPWGAVSYAKTHDSLSRALVVGHNKSKGKSESSKREKGTTMGRCSRRGMRMEVEAEKSMR